jgi:hypothetical protein
VLKYRVTHLQRTVDGLGTEAVELSHTVVCFPWLGLANPQFYPIEALHSLANLRLTKLWGGYNLPSLNFLNLTVSAMLSPDYNLPS